MKFSFFSKYFFFHKSNWIFFCPNRRPSRIGISTVSMVLRLRMRSSAYARPWCIYWCILSLIPSFVLTSSSNSWSPACILSWKTGTSEFFCFTHKKDPVLVNSPATKSYDGKSGLVGLNSGICSSWNILFLWETYSLYTTNKAIVKCLVVISPLPRGSAEGVAEVLIAINGNHPRP